MGDLFRDTVIGHLVRWISKGKLLPHPEDEDNSLWKKYVHEEKTARMAHHGHTEEEGKEEGDRNPDSSQETSRTRHEEARHNDVGMRVDPEKGKDLNVIHFEENDPEDPMNWSLLKKVFVTGEICLLTTSVYIGSAIYSAGNEGVMMQFGVSQTAVNNANSRSIQHAYYCIRLPWA